MSESPTPGLTVSEVLSNRKLFASRYSVHEVTAHSRSFTPTEQTLTHEEKEELLLEEENRESLLTNTNRVLHLSSSPEPIEQEEENLLSHSGLINDKNTNVTENKFNVNEYEEVVMNTADNTTDRETNSELVPWIWWSSKENSPSPEPQTNAHNETYTSTKQWGLEHTENKEMERLVELSEEEEESEQTRKNENHTEETIKVERNNSANVIDRTRSMSLIHERSFWHVHRHSSVPSLPLCNILDNESKTKDYSYITLEHTTQHSQHQQEESVLEEQVQHDAPLVNDNRNQVEITEEEQQEAVVTMEETSVTKAQEVVEQHEELEPQCSLHEELSEQELQEYENKELELKGKEREQIDEVEETPIPTQAELERLSLMWVPCPLSGFPPRYRNYMGGYYCTYCTYSVCEDCYKLIPRALLHSNLIYSDSNNNNNNKKKKSVVNTSGVVDKDLTCSPISISSSLECISTSPCNTSMEHHDEHQNIKCHLCKKGYLIHEEVLLHEWSCEGPMPAIRLKRGANIVYDTNLLQRYYYIKEQREKRATSHEPLVVHYHGMTHTLYQKKYDTEQHEEQQRQQTLFQVGYTNNVHPSCYSFADNRPYCVQEGQSCVFAVDNYRLTVPCVWCAITLIPTSSSSSSSSLFQQTISGMEELSQEHTLCNNNIMYKYRETHDVIYYAYSITPLCIWKCPPSLPSLQPRPFVLSVPLGSYYKHHIHALALYELSEIYHKVSTQFIPLPFLQQQQQQQQQQHSSSSLPSSFAENLYTHNWNNNNKISCSSESIANTMFSFAHDNIHKTNHMTSIPLGNLTSVRILPSQMLSALLVINVLHNDGYHMTQIQRQRELQLYYLSHEFYDNKGSVYEKNKNNNERVKQRTKKRNRERVEEEQSEKNERQQLLEEHLKSKTACNHTNKEINNAVTASVQNEEMEEMEMPHEEYSEQDIELIQETVEVTNHIKAGRHVAVFGLGSKHFFLHHVAHSASLLHYSLCIIDPVYVHNNSNDSKHAAVFGKPINILRQIREIDDYLHKQQEKKELEQEELHQRKKLHEVNAKVCDEQASETQNSVESLSAQFNLIIKEEKTKSNVDIIDEYRHINVISVEDADEDEGEDEKENKCQTTNNYNNKYKTPINNILKRKSSLQRSSVTRKEQEHMEQEMINRNVNVACAGKKADMHERNAHNTTNTTNNVSNVKMLNYKTYHFSHLNNDKEKTLHFTWPAITFANKSIKQNVFAHIQKVIDRERSVKCVKWNALPSFLCSASEEENISNKNETEKLNTKCKNQNKLEFNANSLAPLLPSHASSFSSPSICKLLVVIHNIDQLAESAIRHLAQLCSKWMHSPFAFQILCSFDDVHWLNESSSSSSLSQLIDTLSTTLIIHNLHSLILPRVHEHQHIHPMHLLTEYEGITGNGLHNNCNNNNNKTSGSNIINTSSSSSSLGMHARLIHSSLRNAHKGRNKRVRFINNNNNNSSSTGASAPLHDTMRRILFSLPDTFTELLRIMLRTQEDAGDGVYLSLFHHVEQFENNGLMVSQGRLKALQRELISNRLASYNSAEHSIVIHQHRRLQRVLDEVSALRTNSNNNNKNINTNKKNDTISATIHVENGLADVTN